MSIQQVTAETHIAAGESKEHIVAVMQLSEHVVQEMDQVALIAAETSMNADEVAATTTEKSHSVEQVAKFELS